MSEIFQDESQVRDFIAWCREQKIQAVEIGEIKVAFSMLAFDDPQAHGKDPVSEKEPERDPGTGFTEDELYP